MNEDVIDTLEETGRWHARDVTYYGGRWQHVQRLLPRFQTDDFQAFPDMPPNPYVKMVVRMPRTKAEQPIPVGTVSNTYTLAQHGEVAEKCFEGIRDAGIETVDLRCELGLTELGEWMNLRIYFPEKYNHRPRDQHELTLRLECFNSVDGSSRLVILLGWFRFVCSNGLVIGKTKTELRDVHNKSMNLKRIPGIIRDSLDAVPDDLKRISFLENHAVRKDLLETWANKAIGEQWNKKAACRAYHICTTGFDVDLVPPFAQGEPTRMPVRQGQQVPGATIPAKNLFDVSQALSWLATRRNNSEERVEWQAAIPELIARLAEMG